MGRKLNAEQKRARTAGDLAKFLQQYARKAYSNWDPNDRKYNRDTEERVKRMNPEELDRLMREDEI